MSTRINITEGLNKIDRNKLNIAELQSNTDYTKLAYCTKVTIGMDSSGKPFFKFNIADKYGHTIIGRMFNVEDAQNKGLVANDMVNRVVKIVFSLNLYSGYESLVIKSIDLVNEDIISREEFIGEIQDVDKCLDYFKSVADDICDEFICIDKLLKQQSLLQGIEYISMPNLYAGRKGGAVKFSAKLLKMIEAAFNDSESLKDILAVTLLSEIFMYWKYSCNYEESVLSLGDNINKILSKSDSYINGAMNLAEKSNDVRTVRVCRECKHLLKCYFGYDEPDTFITKSIYQIRKSLEQAIVLEGINGGMLHGTYKSIEQEDGKYYRLVKI